MRDSFWMHDEIARLEAEIGDRQDAADRSLRVMHLSRAGAWIGAGLFLYSIYTGWGLGLVLGVALALGGFALFGSTRSTRQQLLGSISALESRRSELIDQLQLSPA